MTALAASNQRIRRLRRLSRRRSARHDEGVLVLEGPVVIAEALGQGTPIEGLYVDDRVPVADPVVREAREHAVPVHRVAAGVLADVTDTVTPRPVLAVAPIPTASPDDIVERSRTSRRHLVVLVEVRDPGNLGTIVRSAEASGAAGVCCTSGTVDPWSPKVVRSSAGSVLRVPIATDVDPTGLLEVLGRHEVVRCGALVAGGVGYDEAPLGGAVALVCGNEAHGLPDELDAMLDLHVSIPMEGAAESLNVAVAASVLMFDALRQRRMGGSPDGTDHSDWTPGVADDKVSSS